MADKKIIYKEKISPRWEEVVTAALNGDTRNVGFYPSEGELYLPLGDEKMYSVIIKRDGTWNIG